MAPAAGAPTGCFKCGRPGHWSRDCPSSSASLDPSSSSQQRKDDYGARNAGTSTSWKSAKPSSAPVPKLPRKRPKLTPDLLLSNEGIGYVLEHFPRMVKLQGPGHEVDDLKSFLEAFVHWHSLILPYFSFNQFVDMLAKVGSSRRVRTCVNDLRNKIASNGNLKLMEENASVFVDADQDISCDKEFPSLEGQMDNETLPTDMNEDLFDEFYRNAIDEPGKMATQATASNASSPDLSAPGHTDTTPSAYCSISDDQKSRMEANRLKALERAKARAVSCVANS